MVSKSPTQVIAPGWNQAVPDPDRRAVESHMWLQSRHYFKQLGLTQRGSTLMDGTKKIGTFDRTSETVTFTQPYTSPDNNVINAGTYGLLAVAAQAAGVEEQSMVNYLRDHAKNQNETMANTLLGRKSDPTDPDYQYRVAKAREEADKRLRRERRERSQQARGSMPEFSGEELLSLPEPTNAFVIHDLWNTGGQVLLFAPAKVGKSTLTHNVVESLTSGRPFAGRFATTAPQGRVGLIDVELEDWYLGRQLRDLESLNPAHLQVWPLRGRLADFDPTDEANRAEWAARLRQANIEVLIIDCMGPLLKHAGLDEWRDGGTWLQCVRELCAMAGISAHLVVDHASSKTGAMDNGPRGDSAKMDGPDHVWKFSGQEVPGQPGEFKEFILQTIGRALPVTVHLQRTGSRFSALDEFGKTDRDLNNAYLIGPEVMRLLAKTHIELSNRGHEDVDAWPTLTNFWNSNWDSLHKMFGIGKNEIKRGIERLVTLGALKNQPISKSSGVLIPGPRKEDFLQTATAIHGANPFFREPKTPAESHEEIQGESAGQT